MFIKFAFLIFYFLCTSRAKVLQFTKEGTLPPVVIIPGDGGNMIEAKINLQVVTNSDCPKKRDWFRIWLNLKELLPTTLPCQVEILKLLFNSKTNTSYSPQGVDIRIPGFGDTHTVEYIDDSWEAYWLDDIGSYAHQLVEALTMIGLVRNVSIRGAPYDFRISMYSQKEYFQNLKHLVENTYEINGNTRVALISHSLGGLYATWFLNHQSEAWKNQFIDSSITLSSPWGGSSESLQAILSGFTFHHPHLLNPLVARQEQRTWESNFLVLPRPDVWKSDIFVLTDERNFTATRKDLISLFERAQVPSEIFNYVLDANVPSSRSLPPHPGVDTFCIYGTQVPTNQVLDYRGKRFPDEEPDMITIDGDGTVANKSLSLCRNWDARNSEVVEIPNAAHSDVLQGSAGINAVIKILQRSKYF